MEAYKFEATVQKDGVIRIPEMSRWADQRVEIIVVIQPSVARETEALPSAGAFIDKWRGFLAGNDPDQLRSQYLQEKYR
jgi:hypothetical protein